MFDKVVIYGVGLMGGSLALALRERGLARSVCGVGRHYERLKEACQAGLLTECTLSRKEAAEGADVIVVCVPLRHVADAVLEFAELAPPTALITDVGSTKGEIVSQVEKGISPSGALFAGSHPMCGSEISGFEAATSDLYVDATCVVTRTPKTPPVAIEKTQALWEAVGGNVLFLDPEEHDRLAARTSHLPRAVAAALCLAVEREMDAEKRDLMVATGFLSGTRTAAADVDNWVSILMTNSECVMDALGDFQGSLNSLRTSLAQGKEEAIREWLSEAADIRQRLMMSVPIARKLLG